MIGTPNVYEIKFHYMIGTPNVTNLAEILTSVQKPSRVKALLPHQFGILLEDCRVKGCN